MLLSLRSILGVTVPQVKLIFWRFPVKKLILFLGVMGLVSCKEVQAPIAVDDNRGSALQDVYGNPWKFADYKGKWVIVNYWASWCKPCITEVPELEAFYQAHKDKDVVMLGVNYDFVPAAETLQLAEKYGMSYPVLESEHDPRVQMGINPIMVLPTTIVINPEGKITATLVGEQNQASLEELIDE